MAYDTDILIAGGGLNGSSLALALASGGFRVAMVEAHASSGQDGRAYSIARGSQRVLEALGLWSALASDAQAIETIRITDGRAGEGAAPLTLGFDSAEIEDAPMGFMVEDIALRTVLDAALEAEPNVALHRGVQVTGQDTSGLARIMLADGRSLTARLLIGADGKGGQTAARAGIGSTGRRYRQTALVCTLETELPHHGTAHQFFMPAGPLAILPLTGNRVCVVWSEADDTAAAIARADDATFLEILRPRFGDHLGEIALAGPRFSYPLGLALTDRMVAPRLALIGDAAHRMHPIAGQGLNAGLRDVAALAEVLVEARRRGEDPGAEDVLERYQRWRRFDTASLAAATDGFNRLFSNDNPVLRLGRDLGLGMVNRLPGLRRAFIREAAGLTGDLPRLCRGQPL